MSTAQHVLLLIEDNLDDEILSLRGIASSGVPCKVDVVRHGADALKILLDPEYPGPDLILLDFHLPGISGLEILKGLRKNKNTEKLPVVIFSGLAVETDIYQCFEAGANSCAMKPDEFGDYVEVVRQIVRYWLTVDVKPQAMLRNKHSKESSCLEVGPDSGRHTADQSNINNY